MKRFGMILSCLLILASIVILPQRVDAAANAVGVNPRRDYTINPGETKRDTLIVDNLDTAEPLTIKLEVIDFKATGFTGDPQLLLGQKELTKWSLKRFINLPEQRLIPAGQSAELPFNITIPSNAGAGSYYSAIRYQAVNPETGRNVNISGSAVTLMFVRVPGNTLSSLALNNFGGFVPNANFSDGSYKTFFGAAKPKYVSFSLQNKGNIAEQPAGSILMKNIFGTQYKLINNVNPKNQIVLLDQTRRYDVCLNESVVKQKSPSTGQEVEVSECNDPDIAPGRYTADLNLLYGGNGNQQHEIKSVVTIWYLPAWFIISVVAGLLVIAFILWRVTRSLKNRGAHKFRGR